MTSPCENFHRDPHIDPRTGAEIDIGGQHPPYLYLQGECGPPPKLPERSFQEFSQNQFKETTTISDGSTMIPIPVSYRNDDRVAPVGKTQYLPFPRPPVIPRRGISSAKTASYFKSLSMMKNLINTEVDNKTWGVAQQQQRAWEDRYQVKKIGPFRYYAVFDGHGGANKMGPNHVGDYAVNHLHVRIADKLINTENGGGHIVNLADVNTVSSLLSQVFVDFDIEMHSKGLKYGTTCTAVMIDDVRGVIYQINLGDSRSIIFNDNGIISSTEDHSPDAPGEYSRIIAAGGIVTGGRVLGQLMLSRAFGDFDLKRYWTNYEPIHGMVSAVPDIKIIPVPMGAGTPIQKIPSNIILTSDAPFERSAFTNDDLVDMSQNIMRDVATQPHNPDLYELIAVEMVQVIYPRTTDDTTILCVEV